MSVPKLLVFQVILFVISSTSVNAEPILFVHEGVGTGSIDGVSFGETAFVISANGNTNNRYSDGPETDSIPHDSASIFIDGVGTFSFISPTRTFVNRDFSLVGFSHAVPVENDLFNGPEAAQFASWDMLTSIGPITGSGRLLQWNDGPSVMTSGGILTFLERNSPATFTATIIPEPSGFVLLASVLLVLLGRRKHA